MDHVTYEKPWIERLLIAAHQYNGWDESDRISDADLDSVVTEMSTILASVSYSLAQTWDERQIAPCC